MTTSTLTEATPVQATLSLHREFSKFHPRRPQISAHWVESDGKLICQWY